MDSLVSTERVFTSKEEGEKGKGKKESQAKELLVRYAGPYLATSISLSLVSFTLCYVLVNSGVDVPALLAKIFSLFPFNASPLHTPFRQNFGPGNVVGASQLDLREILEVTPNCFAILRVGILTNETGKSRDLRSRIAAHKAAFPIRFPPTVALTPIVAGWLGKKPAADEEKKP